jgi:ASPM-SPD-2-Hydin domain-containing protein/fibronectin type III domain protein
MPFQSRRRLVGRKPLLLAAATAVGAASLIAPTSASALRSPVGPIDAATGFPAYITDDAGTSLDLCLDSPNCLGTKAELTAPDGEAFWWNSEATMPTAGGSALMVLAVEAAYGGDTAGTESAFSRVRFRIDVAKAGDYTVSYPYGVPKTIHVTTPGRRAINTTSDIGCVSAGTFDPCTRERFAFVAQGPITNYLKWDPDALPLAPPGFIGDANTPHKVVGGARSVFRVDGPDIGGPGVNFVETNLMTVQGRLTATPDAPPPTDQTPPGVPTGVNAAAVSSTQINVSWSAVAGAVGYRVYRDGATSAVGPAQPGTTYSDTGLPPASTHQYKVTAVDGVGNESPLSAQAQATTQAAAGVPAAVVGPTSLRFGNMRVGTTRTLTTTIRNAGTAPLQISSMALSGAGAARYTTGGTCRTATPVAQGASCTVTVRYSPTSRTRSLSTLTIASNAGRDAVAISGRGV